MIQFEDGQSGAKLNMLEDITLHIDDFTYMTPFLDSRTHKHIKQDKVEKCLINISNEF